MDCWGAVQIMSGILSLGCFGIGYFFHSRSDPCLAFEHKYMVGGVNCGERKFDGSLASFGIWAICFAVMAVCKSVEDFAKIGADSGNPVVEFVCRLLLENLYTVAMIGSSAIATEASGHVTMMKNGSPLKYEQWASICSIISVLFMMLAQRTANHYGMFDIVESTFLTILLALGKSSLVSLVNAAAMCCSYRLVIFFAREISRWRDRNVDCTQRLIDTAKVCVNKSRIYLNDLEANIPEERDDREWGPIMSQLWNLRGCLRKLEDAIPLQAV